MAIARLSMKAGMKGRGSEHAAYIAREGRFANRLEKGEKLEATESGNMPAWAAGNPQDFWLAADAYERKNGTAYREMEIALPRELSPEQRPQLVRDWVSQELGTTHAYQWAVHVPRAADGGEQPHAHIMFSERRCDNVARDPELYFKRYNSKAPEKGGAKKGYGAFAGQTRTAVERRQELVDLRIRWADMCNAHLEKAEQSVRIDMRSYADQGVDSVPERKMLPSEWRDNQLRQDIMMARGDKHTIKNGHAEAIKALRKHEEFVEVLGNFYQQEHADLFEYLSDPTDCSRTLARIARNYYTDLQVGTSASVTDALQQLSLAEKAYDTVQEDVERVKKMGHKTQVARSTWRDTHKVRAWLHDKGVSQDSELLDLDNRLQILHKEYQARQAELTLREDAYKAAQNKVRETKYDVALEAETTFNNRYYHSAIKIGRSLKIQANNRLIEDKRKKDDAKQAQYHARQERQFQGLQFGRPDIHSSADSKKSEQHTPPRPRNHGV